MESLFCKKKMYCLFSYEPHITLIGVLCLFFSFLIKKGSDLTKSTLFLAFQYSVEYIYLALLNSDFICIVALTMGIL